MFHADIIRNAPKDRTLFGWSVKDGWNNLNSFLKIDQTGLFPLENVAAGAGQIKNLSRMLFIDSETEDLYRNELAQFLAKNQMELKINENLS